MGRFVADLFDGVCHLIAGVSGRPAVEVCGAGGERETRVLRNGGACTRFDAIAEEITCRLAIDRVLRLLHNL